MGKKDRAVEKVELGPAVVPNGRDYGAAIDAASGLSEL